MMPVVGLLEAFDRHGALLARTAVTQWPATVGRSLDCDLVLEDPFVAPLHLQIERAADASAVSVELLDTRNGARLQRKHHAKGERFEWPEHAALELGRSRITLRLADSALAVEQALPRFALRTLALTLALLALVLAVALGSAWLEESDASKYLKSIPAVVLGVSAMLAAWAGLWAIANKVFDGRLQFWRHVRIACAIFLAVEAMDAAAHLSAFAFSWEALSRFSTVLLLLVAASGVYAHLAAVLPRRRVGLAWTVVAAVVLGLPAWLGMQWLDNMRLSSKLYMSSLFPPSLRVAPAVPVDQFLTEAKALRDKLDRRLRDDGQGEADD